MKRILYTLTGLALFLGASLGAFAKDITLLNVSYDPARELYADYNAAFAKYWKEKTGGNITINQSIPRRLRQTGAGADRPGFRKRQLQFSS